MPDKSNSGPVNDFDKAVKTAVTVPSTPVFVMKCCMLGVSRNGTASEDVMMGVPAAVAVRLAFGAWLKVETSCAPGKISDMYIPPVFRENWNRDGARPWRQHI